MTVALLHRRSGCKPASHPQPDADDSYAGIRAESRATHRPEASGAMKNRHEKWPQVYRGHRTGNA